MDCLPDAPWFKLKEYYVEPDIRWCLNFHSTSSFRKPLLLTHKKIMVSQILPVLLLSNLNWWRTWAKLCSNPFIKTVVPFFFITSVFHEWWTSQLNNCILLCSLNIMRDRSNFLLQTLVFWVVRRVGKIWHVFQFWPIFFAFFLFFCLVTL